MFFVAYTLSGYRRRPFFNFLMELFCKKLRVRVKSFWTVLVVKYYGVL